MGFYHIALGAEVPIVLGALDYQNRRVFIDNFYRRQAVDRDLKEILAFAGQHPEKSLRYAFFMAIDGRHALSMRCYSYSHRL
jgi:hypothetical protein